MQRRFYGNVKKYIGVYSKRFTKNDCVDNGQGSADTVTQDDVTGGPFISYISQEDADNKAKEAVEAQGQSIVNQTGDCLWFGHCGRTFYKQCVNGGRGSAVYVNESDVGYPSSTVSQADADNLAYRLVMDEGQRIANERGTCTWTGTYSETFTKNNCADGGTGSDVVVDQDDVTGGPFTSTYSRSEADYKAQRAVQSQGQMIANRDGYCMWTGEYSKEFTRNNCESGYSGSVVIVDQDDVEGGPFLSNVSRSDANHKAQAAVEEQGQSVANKNGTCTAENTDPSWTDTGNTRCNGCSSEKEQKDTNVNSSSYNTTKWVSGGGRSCSNWVYYSSGDCVGHTLYNSYRDECSGTVNSQYSVNCTNCCNCGPDMPTTDYRCSGTTREVKTVDSCGNVTWKTYETNSPSCGGCTCSLAVSNVSFTNASGTKKSTVSSSCGSTSISYTASSNQSWCTVQVVSGGVNVTCTANSSYSSRSATVTVKQNSGNCSLSKTFTVSQDGKPNDYVFTLADGTTSKSYSAGANGGTIKYTITSTKNGSSIGFSTSGVTAMLSPTISGNVLTIIISPNNSVNTRNGSVTLTQNESGKTITISISQAKQ